MNRFAAFWQLDGAPPDIETIRMCGDELTRPAGAHLQAGVCHNLGYVVASWSFPSIDSQGMEAVAFDDEMVLVADARLDDRRSLAANLSRSLRGEIPLEISDAQMLLHAWRAWGETLRQRVIGDYAFVVADVRARCLFAARSHPGWRPLFYAKNRAGVLVASSIDALVCHPEVPNTPCDAAVSAFLAFRDQGRGDPGRTALQAGTKSVIRWSSRLRYRAARTGVASRLALGTLRFTRHISRPPRGARTVFQSRKGSDTRPPVGGGCLNLA